MKIFITGRPRSGKTTLIKRLTKHLGAKFTGFLTEEFLNDIGERIGFRIRDLVTCEEGVLASKFLEEGPKVSKYVVNLRDLERIALPALDWESRHANLILIDEIGAMELCSAKFKERILEIMKSDVDVIATLHRNYIEEFRKYGKVFWLTRENWNQVFGEMCFQQSNRNAF